MSEILEIRDQILGVLESLISHRLHLRGLVDNLAVAQDEALGDGETEGDAPAPEPAAEEMAAVLECLLADSFDPLLRGLLATLDTPRSRLLGAALDLEQVRGSLNRIAAGLPHSPEEDAMLEGEIPADPPTEMRTTIHVVLVEQLGPAVDNLLYAARYKVP